MARTVADLARKTTRMGTYDYNLNYVGRESMTEYPGGRQYWFIDLPGLSRAQAEELLGMAVRAGMSFGGTTLDPGLFLTLHFDRATVESVFCALCSIEGSEEGRAVSSVTEVLKEWLDLVPPEEQ
jgi:hypothetical protein